MKMIKNRKQGTKNSINLGFTFRENDQKMEYCITKHFEELFHVFLVFPFVCLTVCVSSISLVTSFKK